MQIGRGKQGVIVGEYGNQGDGLGTIGWIEPACDQPQWILWFMNNGDAVLYTKRQYENGHHGAVVDDSLIKISARGNPPIVPKRRTKVIPKKSS